MAQQSLLILDTHIWFWWVVNDSKLPRNIAQVIESDGQSVAIASISIYELVLLIQKGRIVIDLPLEEWLHEATVETGIKILETNSIIARQAALLPFHHGDPLDRIIIATALIYDARLASVDTQFPAYDDLQGKLLTGKKDNV